MRKEILFGAMLIAAPVIAIAQTPSGGSMGAPSTMPSGAPSTTTTPPSTTPTTTPEGRAANGSMTTTTPDPAMNGMDMNGSASMNGANTSDNMATPGETAKGKKSRTKKPM